MKALITLEQVQLAYEAGMDEIALYLFKLVSNQLENELDECQAMALLCEILSPECCKFLWEYARAVENDPVEYADYCAVVSIFNPL